MVGQSVGRLVGPKKEEYSGNLKFGTVLQFIAIYHHIKFQVSTVSATCNFYTKNTEITWFKFLKYTVHRVISAFLVSEMHVADTVET